MKRRQLLLGSGATIGGASILGSGAFTSVSAERDVTVAVADDADAFLRLAPCDSPNGQYVDDGNGLLTIDLSGSNGNENPSGNGVTPNGLSRFDDVFEIANQGTQDVCVDFEIEVPQIPTDADVPDRYDFGPGDPAVVFYRGSDRERFVVNNLLNPDRNGAIRLPIDNGNAECIGFEVRAFGVDSGEDLFEGADLTIRADADSECTLPGEGDVADPVPTGPTPDEIDGLVGWYDAERLGLTDGESVSEWPDISGGPENPAEQSPANRQPTYQASAIGNRPAVRFDGGSDRLLASGFSAGDSNSVTVFVVARYFDLPSTNPGLIHAAPEESQFGRRGSKSVGMWVSNSDDKWGRFTQSDGTSRNFERQPNLDSETGFIATQRADPDTGQGTQFVDGDSAGEVSYNGTLQNWSEFGIGQQGGETWDGDIAEVIVYDRALADDEREDVESYLSTKYSIPV